MVLQLDAGGIKHVVTVMVMGSEMVVAVRGKTAGDGIVVMMAAVMTMIGTDRMD